MPEKRLPRIAAVRRLNYCPNSRSLTAFARLAYRESSPCRGLLLGARDRVRDDTNRFPARNEVAQDRLRRALLGGVLEFVRVETKCCAWAQDCRPRRSSG